MQFKLAILTTHPIQYYAPVFKLLAKEPNIQLKVFYSLGSEENLIDKGFGKKITWDIPLLDGYAHEFLVNQSKDKGSSSFNGIKNPTIIDQIKDFKPNAILVYGWSYHSHLKVLRHFNQRVPIWFRGDSTLLNQQATWKKALRNVFLTWVYKYVDTALYVGARNKAYYKNFGLKERQLVFAPHAIDNERFASVNGEESNSIRAALNIPLTDILILFAGKMEPVKNPELLLKAFGKIENEHVHLLLVGNGVLEKKLNERLTSDTEISAKAKYIHFMPFQNQTKMPAIYHACDLFCLPSVSETWGLAINEAMAAGKAILASDQVGCAVDLIKQGENGLTFKSNNLASLVDALHTLVANKPKLIAMGIQSQRIIKDWTFDAQVKAIQNLMY